MRPFVKISMQLSSCAFRSFLGHNGPAFQDRSGPGDSWCGFIKITTGSTFYIFLLLLEDLELQLYTHIPRKFKSAWFETPHNLNIRTAIRRNQLWKQIRIKRGPLYLRESSCALVVVTLSRKLWANRRIVLLLFQQHKKLFKSNSNKHKFCLGWKILLSLTSVHLLQETWQREKEKEHTEATE